MTNGSIGRIVLGGNKFHIVVSQAEIVDGFLNQISVLVPHMPKLGGGNANEKNSVADVGIACRFQPGIVGMAVDFLFQRIEDARPRIRNESGTGSRHFYEYQAPGKRGRDRSNFEV